MAWTPANISTSISYLLHGWTHATNPFPNALDGTANTFFGYTAHVYSTKISSSSYYDVRMSILTDSQLVYSSKHAILVSYTSSKHSYYPSCIWISPTEILFIWIERSTGQRLAVYDVSSLTFTTSVATFITPTAVSSGDTSTSSTYSAYPKMVLDPCGDVHIALGWRITSGTDAGAATVYAYHRKGHSWSTWTIKAWHKNTTPSCGGLATLNTAALVLRGKYIYLGILSKEASNVQKFYVAEKALNSGSWPTTFKYSSAELPYNGVTSTQKWRSGNLHAMLTRAGSIYWVFQKVFAYTGTNYYTLFSLKTDFTAAGAYNSTTVGVYLRTAGTPNDDKNPILIQESSGEDGSSNDSIRAIYSYKGSSNYWFGMSVGLDGSTWATPVILYDNSTYDLDQFSLDTQPSLLLKASGAGTVMDTANEDIFFAVYRTAGATSRYLATVVTDTTYPWRQQLSSSEGASIFSQILSTSGMAYTVTEKVGDWPASSSNQLDVTLTGIPSITGYLGYPAYVKVVAWSLGGEPSVEVAKYSVYTFNNKAVSNFIKCGTATASTSFTLSVSDSYLIRTFFFDENLIPFLDTAGRIAYYEEYHDYTAVP